MDADVSDPDLSDDAEHLFKLQYQKGGRLGKPIRIAPCQASYCLDKV